MEETALLHVLSNIGVPAALCFYTLFNVNRNLEKLTEAVNHWNGLIDHRLSDIEHEVHELKRASS